MTRMSYVAAITLGLTEAMEEDERVFTLGEEVGMGGVYGATQGLQDRFGVERVRDTPISEGAIVGCAVGAALAGRRPVAEIMFMDFLACAMDQVANHAAKLAYMSGGGMTVPLVIRAPAGIGLRVGAQHSQVLEAWLTHLPGLKVACAGTPADARAVNLAAVRDDNPVVVVEYMNLYDVREEVPDEAPRLKLGEADVKRAGDDVTIVAWGASVPIALEAAETLAGQGVDAEVIDLISLYPWDVDAVLESVARTGHLVVTHYGVRRSGFGAEVSAVVTERGFDLLDAPVVRVAGLDVPAPFSPDMEDYVSPDASRIVAAVERLAVSAS